MSNLSVNIDDDIRRATELLQSSKRGVVLSGAGISTPSGIPDFRSNGSGLWTFYNPMEVASLSSFRYNPEKFFAWMRSLAFLMLQAMPNPAHIALARLEQAGHIKTVITQNIDSLHQRAGSHHVIEVHGSLQTLTCIGCYQQWDSTGYIEPYVTTGEIPICPECDCILKPDVILFEEQLPVHTWHQAQDECKKCDLMIVTGSSLEVMPVAGLPMRAVENSARLIVINETPTYIDVRADVVLQDDVANIIPRIAMELIGE